MSYDDYSGFRFGPPDYWNHFQEKSPEELHAEKRKKPNYTPSWEHDGWIDPDRADVPSNAHQYSWTREGALQGRGFRPVDTSTLDQGSFSQRKRVLSGDPTPRAAGLRKVGQNMREAFADLRQGSYSAMKATQNQPMMNPHTGLSVDVSPIRTFNNSNTPTKVPVNTVAGPQKTTAGKTTAATGPQLPTGVEKYDGIPGVFVNRNLTDEQRKEFGSAIFSDSAANATVEGARKSFAGGNVARVNEGGKPTGRNFANDFSFDTRGNSLQDVENVFGGGQFLAGIDEAVPNYSDQLPALRKAAANRGDYEAIERSYMTPQQLRTFDAQRRLERDANMDISTNQDFGSFGNQVARRNYARKTLQDQADARAAAALQNQKDTAAFGREQYKQANMNLRESAKLSSKEFIEKSKMALSQDKEINDFVDSLGAAYGMGPDALRVYAVTNVGNINKVLPAGKKFPENVRTWGREHWSALNQIMQQFKKQQNSSRFWQDDPTIESAVTGFGKDPYPIQANNIKRYNK